MIERHISFKILPDRQADFEIFFNEYYAPAMERQPGFRGVSLLRQNDSKDIYQMVIRFDQEETAAAWRASDIHISLSQRLKTFHSGSEVVVFTVLSYR